MGIYQTINFGLSFFNDCYTFMTIKNKFFMAIIWNSNFMDY